LFISGRGDTQGELASYGWIYFPDYFAQIKITEKYAGESLGFFYGILSGIYFDNYFSREFDAGERPRPIPDLFIPDLFWFLFRVPNWNLTPGRGGSKWGEPRVFDRGFLWVFVGLEFDRIIFELIFSRYYFRYFF
jgi:hypothetical protein